MSDETVDRAEEADRKTESSSLFLYERMAEFMGRNVYVLVGSHALKGVLVECQEDLVVLAQLLPPADGQANGGGVAHHIDPMSITAFSIVADKDGVPV